MKLEQSILSEINHGPVFATKQNYICSSAISNKITYLQFLHLIKKRERSLRKLILKDVRWLLFVGGILDN